jgi:hypothetical protein
MRRFWLKRNNSIWDLTANALTNSCSSFLADPQGLGVKIKIDGYEIERAYFVESVKSETQEISGRLYFKDYAHFSRFIEFLGNIETSGPLRLYYGVDNVLPTNELNPQWYKLVLIKELKKSEIDVKTGTLVCDIKIAAVSRWRRDKVITLELSPFGSPLTYPYIYPYYYGGTNNAAVEIDNTGNLPTSCVVRIEPETDTPTFRVLKDGVLIDQARYNVYVRPNRYALIDSSAENQEASLYTALTDGTFHREDIYYLGERDYTYGNFITIPEGRSLFLFSAVNSQFGKVTVQYSQQRTIV